MPDSWTLRYYFIALIDVLGQSSKLLGLTKLPTTQDEKIETARILHETAGYIMRLRKGFADYFELGKKSTGILDHLPPNQRAIADNLRRTDVKITTFSDTTILTIPLDNKDEHCLSINSIYSALYGICGMFLGALAERKPFRGGVDIGLGVQLTENETYGPALVKAHFLEKDAALYPRIIIGDSLFEYLNVVQQLISETLQAKFAKNTTSNCKALITHDYDKLNILDVIGEGAQSIQGGIHKDLVEKAYEFIVQSHNDFKKSQDFNMHTRYGLLRSYFESRVHLWSIEPIQSL